MRHFKYSILVAVLGLSAAYYWGGPTGLFVAAILGVMEVSLSFDNSVVDATILRNMEPKWRKRFITWGIFIAVFGVRFLLPILIVAAISHHSVPYVTIMAFTRPEEYARHITEAHVQISAFGAMYLLLVFLSFLLQEEKTLHWLGWVERKLAEMGKLESIEVVLALLALMATQYFLDEEEKLDALLAGITGIVLYVLIKSISGLFQTSQQAEQLAHRAGFMSFLYLEMLDLSFSLDGVIGAFAITKDVVIIMLGLAIGAMFMRSLTLFLVVRNTLGEYLFLEHGAHYAIGALAVLMLVSTVTPVSELTTGLTGIGFILLSLWSSIRHKRKHPQLKAT